MADKNNIGTVGWIDLTVENADKVREFYQKVVGWKNSPVSMGEYNDYCMMPQNSDNPVTGICHARGSNKDMPACWMIYIVVENLENSLKELKAFGGEIVADIKKIPGQGQFAIIKDPAGAVSALYQQE